MEPLATGRVIASLRKEAGYTQASLAEALGVSDKAVSKWERGIACPDISLLPKLSILLDTDIEGLFSGEMTVRGGSGAAFYCLTIWLGFMSILNRWFTSCFRIFCLLGFEAY